MLYALNDQPPKHAINTQIQKGVRVTCPILFVGKNDGDQQKVLDTVDSVGQTLLYSSDLKNIENFIVHTGTCIVLLDLEMAGVTNAMIREIKRIHPDVIIIGTSGKAFHPELEDALRTHIFAVISKPIDPEELNYCLRSTQDILPCSSTTKQQPQGGPPGTSRNHQYSQRHSFRS